MKTLIIFNMTDEDLQYFVADGDYSNFHGIVFDGYMVERKQQCADWLFEPESGKFRHEFTTDIRLVEEKNWDRVAVITWLA
jgi:hypothetical protein